ncbi:MFS transporter [Streptomyces montanisoli]|uniref:MFS transporter n=1 Tax=Streptomyces montanisoli TaxID=2798581 RepID=A0A940MG72_9ACTN|nr:MFS transporter [Streptomyces montanisoli]MBP0460502.1 MFS transporter [Streptomyces montanisoli]
MSHTVDTESAPEAAATSPRPGYGQLLRTPGAWTFLLPGFAARQPFAMLTIGIVLLVQHTTGSYGTAGAVAAVTGVAMALFAPQSGKLADRLGQATVLVPGVLVHAASVAALITLALADAPLWALFAAAVPTGASVPQVGPMVRSRWATALTRTPGTSALLPTAAAFESVTDEFTFVIGPVLATALCTGVHPAAGLAAEAALTLVGGLLFAARRTTQPRPTGRPARGSGAGRAASALAVPGVRVLAVAFLGVGAVFGGMQVSLTAFAEEIGSPGVNGPLYGVFAAGNMISGLVFGAVTWKTGPRRRLVLGYTGLTLVSATLWSVHSVPLFAVLGLLAGLCIAPALISGYTLVDGLVEPSARTEAFTWLTGAVALGQAAAVTVAGRLTDAHGARAGFVVPLAGTVLALAVLLSLQSRLLPRGSGRGAIRAMRHRETAAVD